MFQPDDKTEEDTHPYLWQEARPGNTPGLPSAHSTTLNDTGKMRCSDPPCGGQARKKVRRTLLCIRKGRAYRVREFPSYNFLAKITPVFKPIVCRPPKNLACSIFIQR